MANKVTLTRNGQAVTLDEYNKTFNTNASYVKWSGLGENKYNLLTAIHKTFTATLSNIGIIYNTNDEIINSEYDPNDSTLNIDNTNRSYIISIPSDESLREFAELDDTCSIVHTKYYDYKSVSWNNSFDDTLTKNTTFIPTYEIAKAYSELVIDCVDCSIISITVIDGDTTTKYTEFNTYDLVVKSSVKESDRKSWLTLRLPRNATVKIECKPSYGFRFNRDGDDGNTVFSYTMDSADISKEIQAPYFYVGIDCKYPADGCSSSGWYKKGESISLSALDRTTTTTSPYVDAGTGTYNAVNFNGVINLRRYATDTIGVSYTDSNNFILTGTVNMRRCTTTTDTYAASWVDSEGNSRDNMITLNDIDHSINFYASWTDSGTHIIKGTTYVITPADITLPSKCDTSGVVPISNNITFEFDQSQFKENDGSMNQSCSFNFDSNDYNQTTTINCQTGLIGYTLKSNILINGTGYAFGGTYNPGSKTVSCDGTKFSPFPSADNNYLMPCYDATYDQATSTIRIPITLPSIYIDDSIGTPTWTAKTIGFEIVPSNISATFTPSSVDINCTLQNENCYWTCNGKSYVASTTMTVDSDVTLVANAEFETTYTTFKLAGIRCDCDTNQLLGWYSSYSDAEEAYEADADTDNVLDSSIERGIDGPNTYYVAAYK